MNIELYLPPNVAKQPLYQQYFTLLEEGLAARSDMTLSTQFPQLIHVLAHGTPKPRSASRKHTDN